MTSRVHLFIAIALGPALLMAALTTARAETTPDPEIVKRFEFLSQNGNSSCSRTFWDSIADMPADARLQGSCCMAMDLHRYTEQIEGLKQQRSPVIRIKQVPRLQVATVCHALGHNGARAAPEILHHQAGIPRSAARTKRGARYRW